MRKIISQSFGVRLLQPYRLTCSSGEYERMPFLGNRVGGGSDIRLMSVKVGAAQLASVADVSTHSVCVETAIQQPRDRGEGRTVYVRGETELRELFDGLVDKPEKFTQTYFYPMHDSFITGAVIPVDSGVHLG